MIGLDIYLATLRHTKVFHARFANVAETEVCNVQWMDSIMHVRDISADLPFIYISSEGLAAMPGAHERFFKAWDVTSLADLNPEAKFGAVYEMLKMFAWTYKEKDAEGNETGVVVFNNDPDFHVLNVKMVLAARCPGLVQQAEVAEELPAPDERTFRDTTVQIMWHGRDSADLASSVAASLGDKQLAMRLAKSIFVVGSVSAPLRMYYGHLASGRLLEQ
jgi:hypothetical protein